MISKVFLGLLMLPRFWLARLRMVLLMLLLVPLLQACPGGLAFQKAETLEQRAAALLGDFGLYQRAAIQIGQDQSVALEVRRALLEGEVKAKPIADQLDDSLRQYRQISAQLKAGATNDQKLTIAAANLQNWIQQLAPLVTSLRTTVEGVDK